MMIELTVWFESIIVEHISLSESNFDLPARFIAVDFEPCFSACKFGNYTGMLGHKDLSRGDYQFMTYALIFLLAFVACLELTLIAFSSVLHGVVVGTRNDTSNRRSR